MWLWNRDVHGLDAWNENALKEIRILEFNDTANAKMAPIVKMIKIFE